MRTGNNIKPAALRELHGSRKRPRHKRQPTVTPAVPEPPAHLTVAERDLWEYYAPQLAQIKLLSRLDRDTLAQFVEARAQVEHIKALQAEPEYRRILVSVMIDSAGNEKPRVESNPLDSQRRQWTQIARFCAAELGLSPVSRARTAVPAEAEPDELDEFLKARDAMRVVKH